MTGHITSRKTYLLIGLMLLFLTATTVAAAYIDLAPFNDVIAVGIASTKALLIALFFMQARFSTGITRVVILAGLLFVAILVVGVLDDYLTRDWLLRGAPVSGQ